MTDQPPPLCDPDLKAGTPLRRYLDLPKYLDLLRTRALYFRRADRFNDKFEGALTPSIRRVIDDAKAADALSETADTFYRRCRMGTFVSCWTLGAKDNMALWQLYGGAATSVTVNTTVQHLTALCAAWDEPLLIRKVRYIDHFENPEMVIGACTDPLQFKHEAYEFEREVRLLLPRQASWEDNPEGLHRPFHELDALITSVIVSPEAGPWFFDLVSDVSRRYGLKAPVRRSALSSLPG